MALDPVTKDELRLMIDVQSKATEQMVLVAQRLQEIATTQISLLRLQELSHDAHEKIISRLYNGMATEIEHGVITAITDKIFQISKDRTSDSEKLDSIKKDTGWQKIIFGSLTAMVAIALIVSQVIHWLSHVAK